MKLIEIDWDKFRVGTVVDLAAYNVGRVMVEEMWVNESGSIYFSLDGIRIERQALAIELSLVPAPDCEPAWSIGPEHLEPGSPIMFESRAYLVRSFSFGPNLRVDLVRATWGDQPAIGPVVTRTIDGELGG